MESQFTIRDTLLDFTDWVNAYGKTFYRRATGFWFVPYGYEDDPSGDGWLMDTHAPNGFVRFRIQAEGVEYLNVNAATFTRSLTPSEDAELNAYFAELVRAIRLKWEPVALTKTELYEQSFRRLEAGEKPKDVYNNFFRPNLSDADKPKDASQEADDHNAWKSAMTARRNKRKREKG